MNSSSAFGNVLSAAPVQPGHSASARSLTDNSDSPGFKKAFAEVRSEQEVKPKELSAKKTASDKPAKTKAAPDDVADAASANPKPLSASPKKMGKIEEKDQQDTATLGADETPKIANPEPLLAIDPVAIPQAPIQSGATVVVTDLADGVEGAVEGIDIAAPEAASLPITANETSAPLDLAQTAAQPLTATAELPATAVIAESSGDSTLATSEPTSVAVVDPAALGNPVAAVNPATVAATPETLVAAGLAPLKSAEGKLTPATETPVVEVDDALLAGDDAATTDPKVVFEKMLQAIASSSANGNGSGDSQKAPDLAATIAGLASAADDSARAPGLESLSRSPEAQLPSARNFVVQTSVPVSVGQPSWSQAVGEKVLWLAAQNVQSAEIRLDPPELGPMQVKVSVHQEQTSISFTSHNAGVRDLLDQSLGRLRDMFNEQGLNLVNVDVSDKSFQRQQGDGGESQGQGGRGEQEEEESPQAVSAIVHQRLVDHYA